MRTKLWVLLSSFWLGCGGRVVEMGNVVESSPGSDGAGNDATGGTVGGTAMDPAPEGSFEHELVQISGYGGGICGLFSDDAVRCWPWDETTAREVPGLRGVALAGDPHDPTLAGRVCVAERSGKVMCQDNFCNDADPSVCEWFPRAPTEMLGVESAVSIWMGGCQGLALRSDGEIQLWLDSELPCEGNPLPMHGATVHDFQVFTPPIEFVEPIAVIPDNGTFGFVTDSGRAFHTRRQPTAVLIPANFNSTYSTSWPPVEVPDIDDAIAITSSYDATAILRRSGKIWAFGRRGALGIGSDGDVLAEGEVVGIDDAVAIAAGASGMCAIRGDQSLWCWGTSYFGELGVLGPMDEFGYFPANLLLPVKVPGIEGVRAVGMTPGRICVVRGANEVWCWGGSESLGAPYRISFQ